LVVLMPVLEGERSMSCKNGHTGIVSPVLERSSFYLRKSQKLDGECDHYCRACSLRSARDAYRRRREMMTPEKLEAQRRTWREQNRRMAHSPDRRDRRKEANRKNQQRRQEEMGEELRELRRIDAACRKERRGKRPLPSFDQVKSSNSSSGERLPLEPFQRWLQVLVEDVVDGGDSDSVMDLVAWQLGTDSRRLYDWKTKKGYIDYSSVDRAASRHGSVTVEEIYRSYLNGEIKARGGRGAFAFVVYHPEPGEGRTVEEIYASYLNAGIKNDTCHWVPPATTTVEAEEEVKTARVVRCCRSKGCEDNAKEGSRFCGFHEDLLARVRAEMNGESEAFRKTIKKKGSRSTCCRPGCFEPRLRVERYCPTCQADGWDEDDLV
jgi:hypothetical protein